MPLDSLKSQFSQIISEFKSTLSQFRTGRARPEMIEDVSIEAYQTVMKLKELVAITVPEGRQFLITPWDRANLKPVEDGLRRAGWNPSVEEGALRIILPSLTSEEREKLARQVGEKAEEFKVKARAARREEMEDLESRKEGMPEDEFFHTKKLIDEETERETRAIENLAEEKKEQILKV